MKKVLTLFVLIVMTIMSCTERIENKNNLKNTGTMDKLAKQQIEELLAEYKKALNTSDAKLAQSLYIADGIFMPSGAASAIGSENILKSYEFVFSQIQLNVEFEIDEIRIEGDFAFATTASQGTTLIHANGQTIPEENRELFIFEKVNNDWKIARYMFNKIS
jgi:uncharacterized protein (TIGR02246 family)